VCVWAGVPAFAVQPRCPCRDGSAVCRQLSNPSISIPGDLLYAPQSKPRAAINATNLARPLVDCLAGNDEVTLMDPVFVSDHVLTLRIRWA